MDNNDVEPSFFPALIKYENWLCIYVRIHIYICIYILLRAIVGCDNISLVIPFSIYWGLFCNLILEVIAVYCFLSLQTDYFCIYMQSIPNFEDVFIS